MKAIEKRLRALERRRDPRRHLVVVFDADVAWTETEALEAVGLAPAEDDLVVFIQSFIPSTGPRFSLMSANEAI